MTYNCKLFALWIVTLSYELSLVVQNYIAMYKQIIIIKEK